MIINNIITNDTHEVPIYPLWALMIHLLKFMLEDPTVLQQLVNCLGPSSV